MPADRVLATVLQAYQTVHDTQQTNKLLATTTSLLTTLSNPLNITLLTSQLLSAPAIWTQVDGLHTCLRIISIYNTAAIKVRTSEIERDQNVQFHPASGGIASEDWVKAVLKGADDRSPRWKHLLVLGGVLLGMEGQDRRTLSHGIRTTIEEAITTAANLALLDPAKDGILGSEVIVLALNHTFPLLSDIIRRRLNYDLLAPIIVQTIIGTEGFQEGYFIGAANIDIRPTASSKFSWSANSPSFLHVQKLVARPLVTSMGPLSRLAAHAIENMTESTKIFSFLDVLRAFSDQLIGQWRQNKFSEIDPSETDSYLNTETVRNTIPVLWQLLKSAMFAVVVILRAIIGRTLIDPVLYSDLSAPTIASKTLHILRNLHFISSRLGTNAFSAYTFVFMTSIDIISRFPARSKILLTEMRSLQVGQIPAHPLDRNLDLFYLNMSEHFTLILSPEDNDSLIVAAATPYLDPVAYKNLLEIFEAAHSTVLAVLSAPQNGNLANSLIPFYAEVLFRSFPTNLSSRQFRFAFKTLMHITTPPSPLAASQPLLPDTLLELLHHHALQAPTIPLPTAITANSTDAQPNADVPQLSEQAILTLALIDSLPTLPIVSLEEWLPLTVDLVDQIREDEMRIFCANRLWEILENGEMDVERAATCVAWWTTRGGRERILHAVWRRGQNRGPYMSGGLPASKNYRL